VKPNPRPLKPRPTAAAPLRGGGLIHPHFLYLARMLRKGSLRIVRVARSHPTNWSFKHPPQELVPFIQSLNCADLKRALERNAFLYWHPLVQLQVQHLLELHIRWARGDDNVPDGVIEHLKLLLSAHVAAVLPGLVANLRPTARRPGPKVGFSNPYPTVQEFTDEIEGDVLLSDFELLRIALREKKHGLPRRLGGSVGTASLARLNQACREALDESGPLWSGRLKVRSARRSGTVGRGKRSQQRGGVLGNYQWHIDLHPYLATFLQRCNQSMRRRLLQDGKPAAFAYVIVGALLEASPAKIRDALASTRRKRLSQRS
jgi:hypothetical protein